MTKQPLICLFIFYGGLHQNNVALMPDTVSSAYWYLRDERFSGVSNVYRLNNIGVKMDT